MPNFFVWLRYIVFSTSVICSAVIASVSVWNLGFAQSSSKPLDQVIQADSFGIFVGAFSLVGVFTIIFAEVGRTNVFTTQIWFDCLWSGFLFLLNINTHKLPSEACTSTKVLQGFTWLITTLLFAYFLTIFITVFVYSGSDPTLWRYCIYDLSTYDRSNSSARLRSPPSSPMPRMTSLKRFVKPPSIPSIAAPRPQRPINNAVAAMMPYAYRSGLSPDYQIEHFQFPARSARQSQQESSLQRLPTAAGAGPRNLYPDYLRSSLPPDPQPSSAFPTNRSSAVPGDGPSPYPQGSSPPPLGDWPRPDIMTQASRRSHRITPKTIPTSVTLDIEAIPDVSGNSRSKPSGPRIRSGSISIENSVDANRPPPLDLSNISPLRTNR
ncbi:hypothetical protein F5876DRAFT_65383 [Lentinula aff. lateritia]|uniref:Uncharacterized protein n=1 Tax=Lentinula aff. lateritia TaxID=2804960 RepID=A0ACC1U1P8_9AGAR|nr:hypothetical protein F5876DRAFT_65383 [Lentinula aff. lateritia]